jgi:hypothetical protein
MFICLSCLRVLVLLLLAIEVLIQASLVKGLGQSEKILLEKGGIGLDVSIDWLEMGLGLRWHETMAMVHSSFRDIH